MCTIALFLGGPVPRAEDTATVLLTVPSGQQEIIATATSVKTSPEGAIEAFLSAIRTRDKNGVLAGLTAAAADKLGGATDPRVVMNTLRLTRHALYDHDHYRLVEPVAATASTEATQIRKVQLFDRDGEITLVLLRLVRDNGQIWRIDGLTLVAGSDERGV